MAVNKKRYLDYEGLKVYDEKIKALISNVDAKIGDISSLTTDSIHNLAQALAFEIERAKNADEAFEAKVGTDDTAGSILGRLHALENKASDFTEEQARQIINDAIATLVDGAPETFDTLKEISDWISNDENNTAKLVADVAKNTNAVAELRPYVDAQDTEYFNAIGAIDISELDVLFKEKVSVKAEQTLQQAIDESTTEQVIVLAENSTVSDDVNIPAGKAVDANGSTFTGAVTVAKDAVLQNAVFTGKVTVA